jgi:hypothetical protein
MFKKRRRKVFALVMLILLPLLFISCANHCDHESLGSNQIPIEQSTENEVEYSNKILNCCCLLGTQFSSFEYKNPSKLFLINYFGSSGHEFVSTLFKPPKISV